MKACCGPMADALVPAIRAYRCHWVEVSPAVGAPAAEVVRLVSRAVDVEDEPQLRPPAGGPFHVLQQMELAFCPWCGHPTDGRIRSFGEALRLGWALWQRRLRWRPFTPCCDELAEKLQLRHRAFKGFWVEAPGEAEMYRSKFFSLVCRFLDVELEAGWAPAVCVSVEARLALSYCPWCGAPLPSPTGNRRHPVEKT